MKKLMIALAAVAMAAGVHAACMDWQVLVNAATSAGLTASNYKAYIIAASDWGTTAAGGTIEKALLDKNLDNEGFTVDGVKFDTGTQVITTDASAIAYKMILVDTANNKWAMIKEGEIATYDPESGTGTLQKGTTTGKAILGTATSGNLVWGTVQTIPEPTSGLLLLLGVAGLALKRKRA